MRKAGSGKGCCTSGLEQSGNKVAEVLEGTPEAVENAIACVILPVCASPCCVRVRVCVCNFLFFSLANSVAAKLQDYGSARLPWPLCYGPAFRQDDGGGGDGGGGDGEWLLTATLLTSGKERRRPSKCPNGGW